MHAKLTLLEVRKTVFDDAHALEMTKREQTWEPNTNLDKSPVVGSVTISVPIRAKQRSKLVAMMLMASVK